MADHDGDTAMPDSEDAAPAMTPGSDVTVSRTLRHACLDVWGALNPSSKVGLMHQGRSNRLAAASNVITSPEGAPIDAALYVGDMDVNFAQMSQHERWDWCRRMFEQGKLKPGDLVFLDNKALLPVIRRTSKRSGRSIPIGFEKLLSHLSEDQLEHCSFIIATYPGAPGMAAILPIREDRRHLIVDQSDAPIPARYTVYAFPQSRLAEAFRNLTDSIRMSGECIVPGTGYRYDPSQYLVKAPPAAFLDNTNDGSAAWRAWEFWAAGVKACSFAADEGLSVDFTAVPEFGDGILESSLRSEIWLWEFKPDLVEEESGKVQINTGALKSKEPEVRRRRSMMHPNRAWEWLLLLNRRRNYCYCLPCSAVAPSWWSDAKIIEIDQATIAEFKFSLNGKKWFDPIYRLITSESHNRPVRSEALLDSRTVHDDEAFAAFNAVPKDVDGGGVNARYNRISRSDYGLGCWWKTERLNDYAMHAGFGCVLPLHQVRFASNVFVPRVAGATDKHVWHVNAHKLPIALHSGDFAQDAPMLVLSASSRTILRRSGNDAESLTVFLGDQLREPPFPVLFLLDLYIGRPEYHEHYPRSQYLIPSECVNFEAIRGYWATELGNDATVSSLQDFCA